MPTPEQLNLHAAPCPHSPPQSLAASGNPTSECRGQDSPTCWFLLKPPQFQLDPSLISQKAFGRREEPQTHDTRSPPSPPTLSILLRDSNKRQPDRTCCVVQWTDVLGRAEVAGVGHTETPTLIPGCSGIPEGHKTAGIMETNIRKHLLHVPPGVEGHQDKGQGGRRCLASLQGHPKKTTKAKIRCHHTEPWENIAHDS